MAHECPDCGEMCHCGGDIDDCLLNCDDNVNRCTHCICKKCGDPVRHCMCFCPRPRYDESDEYGD